MCKMYLPKDCSKGKREFFCTEVCEKIKKQGIVLIEDAVMLRIVIAGRIPGCIFLCSREEILDCRAAAGEIDFYAAMKRAHQVIGELHEAVALLDRHAQN